MKPMTLSTPLFADGRAERLRGVFVHSAYDDRVHHDSNGRLPDIGAMRRKRKLPGGGTEGGPPAGMVMPDMSIGAVPFPA